MLACDCRRACLPRAVVVDWCGAQTPSGLMLGIPALLGCLCSAVIASCIVAPRSEFAQTETACFFFSCVRARNHQFTPRTRICSTKEGAIQRLFSQRALLARPIGIGHERCYLMPLLLIQISFSRDGPVYRWCSKPRASKNDLMLSFTDSMRRTETWIVQSMPSRTESSAPSTCED